MSRPRARRWPRFRSERLLEAQALIDAEVLKCPDPARWGSEVVASTMPFHPVVDGDVLPAPPIDRIVAGAASDVDVLIGTNADDWRFFPVLGGFIDQVTRGGARRTGRGVRLLEHRGVRAARRRGAGLLPRQAPGRGSRRPAGRRPHRLVGPVACPPAGRRARTGRGATYMYEFAWPSPVLGGRLGACHALEIPFVFDTLDLGHKQMLGGALGQNPPQHLADTMHRAWIEFARHGDPGWPRYEPPRRAVMRFAETTAVLDDPYAAERD